MGWTIIAALAAAASSGSTPLPPPPPADPLTVTIHSEDADRFAALFEATDGKPSAEQIQRAYLDPGSYGVQVFMPGRIGDAKWLAAAIAAKPDAYAKAIRTCLPIVKQTQGDLRAIYLALHGLFPERALPQIYLVAGAGNSGGTAGPMAQVLGLETLCAIAETPEKLRDIVRAFYAHETVHTFQGEGDRPGNLLLSSVLLEGAADFVATLVTGRQIDPARADWATPREAALWQRFVADLALADGGTWQTLKPGTPGGDAMARWIGNYGSAPDGWPSELGYWMGQRMWQRWYDRQPDKHMALRAMLALDDPKAVMALAGAP